MNEHDAAKAKALLDLHGFTDRDGDSWRERPDGTPLRLAMNLQETAEDRARAEIWQKSMAAVGIRIDFKFGKFPENLKASRAGKLMMWGVAWVATTPDAGYHLAIAYMPYKVVGHRLWNDLTQPWLLGYERNVFRRDFFAYVDIDTERLAQETR